MQISDCYQHDIWRVRTTERAYVKCVFRRYLLDLLKLVFQNAFTDFVFVPSPGMLLVLADDSDICLFGLTGAEVWKQDRRDSDF